MKNLVTILSDLQEMNLGVAKSYLADNGIECFVNNAFGSMYTGAGAWLQVAEEDVEEATKLLKKGDFID